MIGDWRDSIKNNIKPFYENDVISINDLKENCPVQWKYMTNKTVLFDNIALKIISYNAEKQKITFEYLSFISTVHTEYFLDFNEYKIKEHIKNILFLYEIGEVIADKSRNLVVIDKFKINKKKYYKVKCNICEYCSVIDEFTLKEHDYSCRCCNGNVVVEGVNDIPTTDHWMVDYFQGGYDEAKLYTHGSSAKIYFKCPYCHKIHEKAIMISDLYNRKKLNCLCMDYISYPEKFMRNFLNVNYIDYMYHVGNNVFSWCKNYIYDFYVPSKKIIIETHGEQHYDKSFQKITLDEQKQIDKEKKILAESNGFTYVIVDCRKSDAEYIYDQIKISKLDLLLNISQNNIDLLELDRKSRSNILKEICDDYQSNKVMPNELSKKYKLNISTICKYLHIGTKIGWCDYDPIINLKNGQKKTLKIMTNRKKIIYGDILVFDDNEKLIGRYANQHDAAKSLNDNGIKISVATIGSALKRDNHKSKGYYFYYENEIKKGE